MFRIVSMIFKVNLLNYSIRINCFFFLNFTLIEKNYNNTVCKKIRFLPTDIFKE